MHIGFFTPEYATQTNPDGGLANYVRKTGQALAGRGHKVSVFVSSKDNATWLDGAVRVFEVGQPVYSTHLPSARLLKPLTLWLQQNLSARRMAEQVWKVHVREPFDIFQSSTYGAPGLMLRHNGRVPLVCRVSSYTPLIRSAYGRRSSLGDRWLDGVEKRLVREADASFAPSQFMAETYSRYVGVTPAVLRTPVDEITILPDPSFYQAHFSGASYLIFFGTLSRIKGIDLLTEALPSVLQKYPGLSVVLIGRDDGLPDGTKVFDSIQSGCMAYAERLLHFPALPKAQLYPVVEHALGSLMPSRVDNYPNSALEALSLGVPVIGSYGSSLEEIVTDGQVGFLARNGDPQSLSEAILRLLDLDPMQRQIMREKCLAASVAMQNEDRIGQLIDYYMAVIEAFRENHRELS